MKFYCVECGSSKVVGYRATGDMRYCHWKVYACSKCIKKFIKREKEEDGPSSSSAIWRELIGYTKKQKEATADE